MTKNDTLLQQLKDAFLVYDKKSCLNLVKQGLEEGMNATDLVQQSLLPSIQELGEKFETKKIQLAYFILGSEILRDCMKFLKELARTSEALQKTTMILGSVPGDIYYETRMQVISAIFEANSIRVINIGGNASGKKFLETARAENAEIIAISTYVQEAAFHQKAVVDFIRKKGSGEKFIILIGGTGIPSGNWAQKIDADIVTPDLKSGLAEINRLLKKNKKIR